MISILNIFGEFLNENIFTDMTKFIFPQEDKMMLDVRYFKWMVDIVDK